MTPATSATRPERKPAATIDRVVVINDDAVASGGAATIALASAVGLAQSGIRVTFLTGDAAPSPLQDGGIEVVRLGGRHLFDGARSGAALRGLYDPRTRRALEAWIAQNDTPRTVYHLHNWHKYLSPSVFGPLRRVDERLVMSLHDFFLVCPNGGFYIFPEDRPCSCRPMGLSCHATACDKRSVAHKAWRSARQVVRGAMLDIARTRTTFLAVHDGMIDLLGRGGLSRDRVSVLPNPVRPWLDTRCEAERNADILFVGRLEADKGIGVLADAARQAGCRLRVIGDGPLRPALANSHPEVEFLGRRDREGIAAIARDARLVAVPTLVRETYGLVAMEALASGIPVVISDTACIGEEVASAGMGVLCKAGSVSSLAVRLAALAHDDASIEAMSRSAYATARAAILSHADWCDRLIDIYGEKLSGARKGQPVSAATAPLAQPLPLARVEQ